MTKSKLKYLVVPIVALPAVVIGAIAMKMSNVPNLYFVLNAACLLIGWLASCVAISRKAQARKNDAYGVIAVILALVFYGLTFIDPGISDVHRWISVGPISVYVSSVLAPVLIIALGTLLERNHDLLVGMVTLITAVLLVLQPDASQVTAFAIPMGIILFGKTRSGNRSRNRNRSFSYLIGGALILLVFTSWIRLDSLPAVMYVERILGLVMDMGLSWAILGVLSLIVLPLPFLLLPAPDRKILSWGLGLYFGICIVSTFFGSFPVPLMGYGVSPIIGYLVAMTWLIRNW